MVKVFEGTDEEFYMDGYALNAMQTASNVVKNDWDMVIIIDGYEGSGKSVIAQQMAKVCDHSLTVDRIVFTPEEFEKAIHDAEPYQAIIYDEGYTGLSSRATMSKVNRALVSMIAEIRQKNLFVFVVMPTFFDLDKYVALWRSRALIHVYTPKPFQRGAFAFYDIERKKDLYINGKKYYSYSKPKPNFIGSFTNHYTVPVDEYKKKKAESLKNREKKVEDEENRQMIEDALLDRLCRLGNRIPHSLKMEILRLPESTYYFKLKKWREENSLE